MNNRPTLQTDRLILRPFVLEDSKEVQRLAGDSRIAATTLTIPHPYKDGMAGEWISTHEIDFKENRQITFAITDKTDNSLVGSISIRLVSKHNNAEMGYWVGVPFWGKGYCTEAAAAVVKYAFETLELNKVYAHFMTSNPSSGRVMEKIGMASEGLLRQHVDNGGKYEDLKIFGICKSDYLK